jgi:hypothetical protein
MTNHISDTALETALAIIGRTGSGKTYAAKGLCERLLGESRRICIIDPTGAWWGLRIGLDGGAGFPVVIFGGEHADIPLAADAGETLGEAIAHGKVPQAVIDVSEFSNAEQIRFLTAFCETLYARTNRQPLHLICDEADILAPQNPLPEARRLQGAMNKIVRRGRIKGLRPILITQRPAVIDKSVLGQANTLIAMRLTAPQDRKAISEWMAGHGLDKKIVDELPRLPVGTGLVFSGDAEAVERVQFPAIATHDSSRAPKEGEQEKAPQPLDENGLEELRAALAPAASTSDKGATAITVVSGALREMDARIRETRAETLREVGEAVSAMLRDLGAKLAQPAVSPSLLDAAPRQKISRGGGFAPGAALALPPKGGEPAGTIAARHIKILNALAWWSQFDIHQPTRHQLAAIAGYAPTSGNFGNLLGTLKSEDLISYPAPGLVEATGRGIKMANIGEIPAGRALDIACLYLEQRHARILQALATYTAPVSRQKLADKLGLVATSGNFGNLLGHLSTLQMIKYPDRGMVTLADWLR